MLLDTSPSGIFVVQFERHSREMIANCPNNYFLPNVKINKKMCKHYLSCVLKRGFHHKGITNF